MTAHPDDRQGVHRAWLLVARREILVRATDRTFLVGTLVTVALLAGLVAVQALLAGRMHTVELAALPADRTMATLVAQRAPGIDHSLRVEVRQVADAEAARALVRTADAAGWLHADGGAWTLTTKSEPDPVLQPVVAQVVRDATLEENARAAGTTATVLERGTQLQTGQLEGDGQRATLVQIVGFAFATLFYTASLIFGIALAGSVVEEKQSRIVEIIATAIPLRHLLAGKVIGNSVLALGQLLLYVAVGLIGLAFTDFARLVPSVSGAILWFVVFFLAGFVSLACWWAVAGALASRSEDLQSTTTPLNLLMIGIFFASFALDGTAQRVASFVPPLSAVLMPMRLLAGDAAWWEALAAMVLLLAVAALTIALGERLYRRSLLQTGGRVSLRSAWRAEE